VWLCTPTPIGLNGRNAEKCIRLVREKLRIFQYGQYITLETSFYWLSGDIVRFKIEVGVLEKCTKT